MQYIYIYMYTYTSVFTILQYTDIHLPLFCSLLSHFFAPFVQLIETLICV